MWRTRLGKGSVGKRTRLGKGSVGYPLDPLTNCLRGPARQLLVAKSNRSSSVVCLGRGSSGLQQADNDGDDNALTSLFLRTKNDYVLL